MNEQHLAYLILFTLYVVVAPMLISIFSSSYLPLLKKYIIEFKAWHLSLGPIILLCFAVVVSLFWAIGVLVRTA